MSKSIAQRLKEEATAEAWWGIVEGVLKDVEVQADYQDNEANKELKEAEGFTQQNSSQK